VGYVIVTIHNCCFDFTFKNEIQGVDGCASLDDNFVLLEGPPLEILDDIFEYLLADIS
jgi:hypothetical protein